MPFADDLLEQAHHLARREPRRPRQASLRRAISTAYYALFHLLTTEAVSNWKIMAHRTRLARIFDHRAMNAASVRAANFAFTREDRTVAAHLRNVAKGFGVLYENRHTADYDNAKTWSRTDALELIEIAEEAFASWKAIRHQRIANDCLLSLFVKDRS